MSAIDKTSLGYGTHLSELSSNHETDNENSLSVFDVRSSDEESTPANDMSSKADEYHVIPPPITGNFLTPRANISFVGLDEYDIMNKIIESQTTELNTKTSETTVIIEDWNSDDEEKEYEVQTVRPETQTVKTRDDKNGQNSKKQGIGFRKVKACFVWRANQYRTIPKGPSISTARPVSTARPSVSTVRPVSTARPVSTVGPSVSTVRPVCTARLVYASRSIYPRMDNVRPIGSCSPIKRSYYTKPAFRPKDLKQDVTTFGVKNMTTAEKRAVVNTGKGKLDTDLKKSRWVWRPKGNYLDHVSKDSGSFMLKKDNPEILLQDHAVVDSGFSSHMTGNKAYLSDYEDFNGGFVAFGSDPKGGTQDSYVAGSSGKDKGPTQEYILLPLQPHRTRIPIKDVVQVAQEKPSKNASLDKDIQDSEDVIDKEGQPQMPEDEQVLHDELEKLVTQELTAKAMDDVLRQAFEEERGKLHLKRM
ncbi:hypothetical protein Tco_1487036 [Tanacetum coccineum]